MHVPSIALRTIKTQLWCVVIVVVVATVVDVASLNGPNVCMIKQKYNITKRVKYRAPMSVRTYEWCFSMPPRCSRWNTEMKDLTRLETEERIAELAVCCPGYKMKDVSCVPICPHGKTGPRCSDECPPNKWGPNCVHNCSSCADHGKCSPVTGECECEEGWQGESCEIRMSTTQASTTMTEEILTTTKSTSNTNSLPTTGTPVFRTTVSNASAVSSTTVEMSTMRTPLTSGSSSSISTTITSPVTIVSPSPTNNHQSKELSTSERITTTVRNKEIEYFTEWGNPSENIRSTVSLNGAIPTIVYDYVSATIIVPTPTTKTTILETTTTREITETIYNRTEPSIEIESTTPSSESILFTSSSIPFTNNSTTDKTNRTPSSTVQTIINSNSSQSISSSSEKEFTTKTEVTRKPESTVRTLSTAKFKPKEIWIKPTQKGESTIIDFKIKPNHELTHLRHRVGTKKEITSEFTTPRTIIVSIIPTSVSYSTFKKIALTTSSYFTARNITSKLNKTENGITHSVVSHSSLPPFITKVISSTISRNSSSPSTFTPIISKKGITSQISVHVPLTTNSMTSMEGNTSRLNSSNFLKTVSSSINSHGTLVHEIVTENMTKKPTTKPFKRNDIEVTTKAVLTSSSQNVANKLLSNIKPTDVPPTITEKSNESVKSTNVSNTKHLITTEEPVEDETFHILTEPEHITAVMSDKERDRSSMDLISVVSIAGGVMMAIITVAVIIVMIERCRRPRFDDIRKVNDIRMQVMIDNSDSPPPYSRSIFHTPLPEPPALEKCHYQPISTLDRNLKQFMRPVVVQSISPIMLENFRGILECHYDHLPRRNHDFGTMPTRLVSAPSMSYNRELRCHKSRSVNDSTIDAIKCEAKLDAIDSTTSEPLYAEIPCWRPPSEHAIEVVNGEAITEL